MDYELIVIGAGPGGYEAAIRAAQLGLKTALVEKGEVGGTCLNRGCIPTKSLLHDAHSGKTLQEMMTRKNEVVQTLRSGIEMLVSKNKITLIRGEGIISAAHQVQVNEETITAEHILIAAGSIPARPPIPGLEMAMTSDEFLGLEALPEALAIIGGGVIGVEFATVFAALGVKVIIVEAMDRILPLMDREISQNLNMILKKQGVEIHTAAKVSKIQGNALIYEEKGAEKTADFSHLLVATGRRPNTARLFSGDAPEMERGFIKVNERYESSLENVYAIGDAIGGMMLAHQASAQGINCVEMIKGIVPNCDAAVIPACVYTSPEIATVGITQDEAKEKGIETLSGKYIMGGNGRTLIENGQRGFIKIVAEKETGKIIGAQLMCQRATDMIGEMTTAIVNGLTYHQLAKGVRAHPTFNEGVVEALHAIDGSAIHAMPAGR